MILINDCRVLNLVTKKIIEMSTKEKIKNGLKEMGEMKTIKEVLKKESELMNLLMDDSISGGLDPDEVVELSNVIKSEVEEMEYKIEDKGVKGEEVKKKVKGVKAVEERNIDKEVEGVREKVKGVAVDLKVWMESVIDDESMRDWMMRNEWKKVVNGFNRLVQVVNVIGGKSGVELMLKRPKVIGKNKYLREREAKIRKNLEFKLKRMDLMQSGGEAGEGVVLASNKGKGKKGKG